jgi:hypothetical protein
MANLRALLVVGLACAGCATTTERSWLSSPIATRADVYAEVAEAPAATTEPRPRLSHTVTLGETYVGEAKPAVSGGSPPVQVNVHTQVPIVVNNYSGYGYGYGGYGYGGYGYGGYGRAAAPRTSGSRTTSAAPIKVGGDFPPPPDYGPRALR